MGRNRKGIDVLDTPLAMRVPSSVAIEWRAAAKAANLSLADWLRQAVEPESVRVTGRPTPRRRSKLSASFMSAPDFIFGLARVGNNLNQLARWANIYKSKTDTIQILVALNSIERQLATLSVNEIDTSQKWRVECI